jgi:hypothetical protein
VNILTEYGLMVIVLTTREHMEVEMRPDRRQEAEELATQLATGALQYTQLDEYQLALYRDFQDLMDLTRAAYSGEIQPAPSYPKADLWFLNPREILRRMTGRSKRRR